MKNRGAWTKRLGMFLLVLVFLATGYGLAQSAGVEDFYKGKTLTFFVPYSPGGGYDFWARLMAPYLAKNSGASVIVVNKPGASGLIGFNQMYNEVKPDGLTIAIAATFGLIMDQWLGDKGVKYDYRKFKWLGRISYDDHLVTTGKVSPYRSVDAVKKAPRFKFGVPSRTTTNGAAATAFSLSLGLENVRMVAGYSGNSEIRLAVLRGEVDGMAASLGSSISMIKSGDLIPHAFINYKRSKDLPAVPTIFELNPNISAEAKKLIDVTVGLIGLGRAIIMPPNTPDDKVVFLSNIIQKALQYPELIRKAEGAGFSVDYVASRNYLKDLNTVTLTTQEKTNLIYMLLQKYPD